ncbi:MAG TPA: hypothetical protein VM492_10825 [Sumerlaeia bacterium]|nr:hypothetical protein [Sumerlaeia bacterium]
MNARCFEKMVIAAVALHSLMLGAAMLFWPAWTLDVVGWEHDASLFFPAQSGVFLLILGGAYMAGVWHRPFAWLLIASKATAVVFLVAEYVLAQRLPLLLLAALFDGLMGAAVALAIAWSIRSQSSR